MVLSGLGLGGVQRTMLTLAGGLADRGETVDLVVPNGQGPFRAAVPDAVRLVELDSKLAALPWVSSRKRRRSLASSLALGAYLRRERPAVAISASHYVNLSLLLARDLARLDLPVIVSQRTHLSRALANAGFPFRQRPLLAAMVRHAYPKADRIAAVSEGVGDDLAAVGRMPRGRIHCLPNPLRLDEVRAGMEKPAPHPWLADDGPPVCLGLGRLAPQKDFMTLLRAFASVRARRPARLIVLGEGRERPRLEAEVARLGLAADVELPGYADNPFAWLAKAQLFILSSSYEGLPGALIQALACGCPSVSTDCDSGPREILQAGELGALVPVGNVEALAQAMAASLDQPVEPERLRARAADFGVDRVVDAWLDLIAGVRP